MSKFISKGSNDVEQPVSRYLVFAVYDEKAQAYGMPITHPTVNVAIRSFTSACQNPESFLSKFASDYALYHIGTYDEFTGSLVSYPEPRFIIRASEICNQLQLDKLSKEIPNGAV